jgi:hypothetical protein
MTNTANSAKGEVCFQSGQFISAKVNGYQDFQGLKDFQDNNV